MAASQKKSKAALKREIIAFLDKTSGQIDFRPKRQSCGIVHKNALVLATAWVNKPRATVLEFFNEGLTLYIWGEPGGKIGNIRRNPQVSAVVYEQPLDHSKFQRSLQIFGTADLISVRNNPRLFRAKARKWNILGIGRKILSPVIKDRQLSQKEAERMIVRSMHSLNLIKITPHHIILKEYHPDFTLKRYEWKK